MALIVKDNNGKFFEVPAGKEQDAIDGKFIPATPEEIAQLKEAEEFQDRPIAANLAAAADSLTLGAFSPLAVASGLVKKRTLTGLNEYNNTVPGEILGAAIPMVLSAPVSAGAKVVGAAKAVTAAEELSTLAKVAEMTPVGLLQKIGTKVASGTKELIGAEGTAAKILSGAAQTGVEAGIYGGAMEANRQYLENEPLSYEKVAAQAGLNTLLGGAFGATPAILGAVTGRAKEFVTDMVEKTIKDVDLKKAVAKITTGLSGENMEYLAKHMDDVENAVPYGDTARAFRDPKTGALSKGWELQKIKAKEALNTLDNAAETIEIKKLQDTITPALADLEPNIKISDETRRAYNRLSSINGALDLEKKAGVNMTPKRLKSIVEAIDEDATAAYNKLQNGEKLSVYDKSLINVRRSFDDLLKSTVPAYKEAMEPVAEITKVMGKMNDLFSNPDTVQSKLLTIMKGVKKESWVQTYDNYIALMKKNGIEVPDFIKPMKDYTVQQDFEKAITNGSRRVNLGAIVFGSLGGPVGAAAGAVAGATLDVYGRQVIKFLIKNYNNLKPLQFVNSRLINAVNKTNKMINIKMDGFLDKSYKSTLAPISVTIFHDTNYNKTKREDKQTQLAGYKARSQEITELFNNPQQMVDRLNTRLVNITEAAPQYGQGLTTVATRAVNFLFDKMPKKSNSGLLINQTHIPSSTEVAKFSRYLGAVEKPLSVLDSLNNSILTSEEIEAVSTVYPELMKHLQVNLMNKIAIKKPKLSYRDRLQISVFMQQPMDPTLDPNFINKMQQLNLPPEERKSGNIDIGTAAENMQTETERITNE